MRLADLRLDYPTTVTIIGVDPTSTPLSKASPSSEGTTSPTPTPSQSLASNPPPTSKDNSKAALGAGLGVGLGVPLLSALGFIAFLTLRRRRSHITELNAAASPRLMGSKEGEMPRTLSTQWSAQRSSPVIHEVNSDFAIHEVPSSPTKPHELPAKDQWGQV